MCPFISLGDTQPIRYDLQCLNIGTGLALSWYYRFLKIRVPSKFSIPTQTNILPMPTGGTCLLLGKTLKHCMPCFRYHTLFRVNESVLTYYLNDMLKSLLWIKQLLPDKHILALLIFQAQIFYTIFLK
jgi:hypothetical protein